MNSQNNGILGNRLNLPRNSIVVLAGLAALSILSYLLVSRFVAGIGFPLDDAWIHQTYARNLARYGRWEFLPNQPSAGSTSPLWSGALAVGFVLRLDPFVWTFSLSWILLFVLAVVGSLTIQLLCPMRKAYAIWAGVFLIFEWHLVWAACSGMETLFFSLLVLVVLTSMARSTLNWFGVGMMIGLCIWVRPDAVTLFGPGVFVLILNSNTWNLRMKAFSQLLLGSLIFVLPYLVFNISLSGSVLPNTFFSKQAEYAAYRQFPLMERVLSQLRIPLIGAGALLVPGFVIFNIEALRRRIWTGIAGSAWFLGYVLIYAIRLPVTYQHGRYIIPALSVYFIWSIAGLGYWIDLKSTKITKRILGKAWLLSLGLLLGIFWFMGARAYGRDVAIINSEMVAVSLWVAENTETGALVAAHDIGALGYFSDREILDLAGLVSPEVIPFIRDEKKIEALLDKRRADYLVTFPNWYPNLVKRAKFIYSSEGAFSPSLGGENMSVYRWVAP